MKQILELGLAFPDGSIVQQNHRLFGVLMKYFVQSLSNTDSLDANHFPADGSGYNKMSGDKE